MINYCHLPLVHTTSNVCVYLQIYVSCIQLISKILEVIIINNNKTYVLYLVLQAIEQDVYIYIYYHN